MQWKDTPYPKMRPPIEEKRAQPTTYLDRKREISWDFDKDSPSRGSKSSSSSAGRDDNSGSDGVASFESEVIPSVVDS